MIRNEAPDFFGGSAVQGSIDGTEPAMEDSLAYGHLIDSMPQRDDEAVQVAGIGSVLGRIIGRPVSKAVKGVVPQGVQVNRQLMDDALLTLRKERQLGAQARRVDLEAQRQGGTPPVPIAEGAPSPRATHGSSGEINLERAHPGAPAQDYVALAEAANHDPGAMLRMIRSADEMGDMLDAIGAGLHEAPRTHESIRAEGFDYGLVAETLTQGGLANDRQLFALRSLIATLGEKAAVQARRIYQGDHSPELLLEYEKTGQQLMAFVAFTKGQTREVARALSQQNMLADTLSGNDLRAFEQALNASTAGDPKALIDNASALVKKLDMGMDPGEAFKGALERRTKFEAFIEFWKANNLSSVSTQAYNLISAPIVMFAEMSARGFAATVGEARHAAGIGSAEYYSAREFQQALIGGLNGLRHSLAFFWHTIKTGESQMGAYGGKEVGSSAIYEQFTKGWGWSPAVSEAIVTPAFRAMKAVDDAMMLPPFMAELSGLATRDGVSAGLTGDRLARHVDRLVNNPTYEMQQEALEAGRKVVMQASSEDPHNAGFFTVLGELVHRGAKMLPIFQFVVPWIKTPARILDYAVESSVLATVSPRLHRMLAEGGATGDIAAGKMILGTAFTASMLPLIATMQVTGEGPEDPEQRRALERKGWLPYSFKVGDTYVSYRNWGDPVIGVIAGIATALERARFARQDTDVAREVTTGIIATASYMLEASYMEGFKRFLDATQNATTWAQYVGSLAQGAVPYGGFFAGVARSVDQTDRSRSVVKSSGFGGEGFFQDIFNTVKQDFKLRLPGLRDTARPARYWDGDVKVPEGPEIVKNLLPMNMRTLQADRASDEMIKYGVKVSEPRSRFDFGTKLIEIELLDLDGGAGLVYDEYIKQVGKARREAVEIVINTYNYKAADAGVKGLMLDHAISQGAIKGKAQFFADTLLPLIESGHPGLEKSGREQGMNLQEFVRLLLTKEFSRAIVPQSRREIEMPPALEFK